ncbi:Cysteine/Histidine-rich C1 domain family protein, putative isoform 1 [Hibiscus syriacus]|uniref:Glycosyltransferase family 92 protein n=1 Tax=Hibiscus syriacus TaxID=106335 RepID=A0A6A2ZYV7_HIBSY|nr:galactan beta-1,4-galactosyltransferase GALS1-like [Hibiscus syriacus]XP_039008399.1 galactan beta-1,4-galactosyltransferase GALS1-like [Hibiscus syriacus]KAE8697180.1 Cysteine/Histidine-rich C1 domain family protein, putative isoform 1 [Hibiscus syriacus]
MRKEPPPSTAPSALGKLFLCFETKPLVVTLLALTLLMLLWNFPPYLQNLSTATRPCSATSLASVAASAAASTSLLSTNASLPYTATPVAEKKYYSDPKAKPRDPNKRVFEAHGNAAALFVQMGAYRGGSTTFAVVGLASKPVHVFGRPWYKCEWISNNGSSFRALAYKMLPDWGYGRVYTVVVVNCTFPFNPNQDNLGGKLMINAYYGESPRKYERFTALEESSGSYNEAKYHPPFQYEYLYCGSSLYGNLNADRMREWMAYHAWFFGPSSHFVFHDAGGVSPEVRAVLEPWVRAGRATVQDIRDQAQFDGYYYNQFLVVNDCLHRYRHAANWTFFFDVDEYIYLPDGNILESVLNEFSNYTQFTIEQNPMSSVLCLNDSSQQYSRQWGFEKLLFRESRTGIRRDRKYAIQAKNAYATGVHMSENVIGKALHKTERKIRYYHYHNTITVHEELCREFIPPSSKNNVTWFNKLPYVYDDNMKKLANTIKEFERKTIGDPTP